MNHPQIFGALILSATLATGSTHSWASESKKAGHSSSKAMAKTQTVRVVIDGAYKPATVNVKVGVPTTLLFTLKRDAGCGNTVVIPALKKTLSLQVGQTRSVSFTPQKNQTIAFACPMKMLNGKIVAR